MMIKTKKHSTTRDLQTRCSDTDTKKHEFIETRKSDRKLSQNGRIARDLGALQIRQRVHIRIASSIEL